MNSGKCKCSHHMVTPFLVIAIAIIVLLGNVGVLSSMWVGILWPICLGLIGCIKLLGSKCHCCSDGSGDCSSKEQSGPSCH